MAAISPRRRRRTEWAHQDPIGVGAELRKAREMLGLEIEEISDETKIRIGYLLALEDEDFRRLPTGVAGRGLLRSYATYLGLDAVELLSALEAHGRLSLAEPAVERGVRRSAPTRSAVPRLLSLVVAAACVLALGYYLVSQYSAFVSGEAPGVTRASVSTRGASPTPTVPPPTATATVPTQPQATVKQAAAAPVVAPVVALLPTATLAPRGPGPSTGPVLLVPSPTPAPARPTPVELVVEASITADTHVTSQVDGETFSDEDVPAGDQRTWRGSSVTLQVQNAGAVEVVVNGRPAGKLGQSGQAKTVTWTR